MSTPDERRRYDRYETDIKIQFYVNFDLKTNIKFRIKEKAKKEFSTEKHSAVGKNVSVEGLGFNSGKKLSQEDKLLLEVYVPSIKEPIVMEGVVRWCHPVKGEKGFETGVKVLTVNGESVEKTIFIDRIHNIAWSTVLESVFGGFKTSVLKRKKSLPDTPKPKRK